MNIKFNSQDIKYKNPFGALKEDEKCLFRICIPKEYGAKWARIILEREDGFFKSYDMICDDEEYHTAEISIREKGLYFYYFIIDTEDECHRIFKTNEKEKWQLTCYSKNYSAPKWAKSATIYQIFPDRFNKSGNPELADKLLPFYVHPDVNQLPMSGPDDFGNWNFDFFGGNFLGICEKLDYLEKLGIDIIYLNPVSKAFSNHRYDTYDYLTPDPMLGTANDFKRLCEKAHEKNIKIIIDGVYSHTGKNSLYFNSALNDKNSIYADWYEFYNYPDDYKSWWGIKTLPQIKKGHIGFINFITQEVIPFWFGLGTDGIRLDVADELTDDFIRKIAKKAKEIKEDALIIGEVWEDASNKISYGERRGYLFGDELDGVMNYPLRNAIIGFVKKEKSADDFSKEFLSLMENYPKDIFLSSMNLISSHDTPRIFSLLNGSTQLHKIAVFLQFMLPGAPTIYYGDEIGMEGENDPFNRKYFCWDKTNGEITQFYFKICKLRKDLADLKSAEIMFKNQNGVLVFYRKKLKIVVNMTTNLYEYSETNIFGNNKTNNQIAQYEFAVLKKDA